MGFCGGSIVQCFRVLELEFGGPWFKSSTLLLHVPGFVLGSREFNSATALCKIIANWSASHQLGFLIVYVLFEIFVNSFTVSPIISIIKLFTYFIYLFIILVFL